MRIGYGRLLIGLGMLWGCASNQPTAASPFVLIEGKRVGSLELVQDDVNGASVKERDSLKFDNRYLHTKPRIGFKFSGQNLAFMRIYDGDKVLKTCDEGSYTRDVTTVSTGGGWEMGPNGKMWYTGDPGTKTKEVYGVKYDLECEVANLKPGMIVEIHDGDGPFAKYRMSGVE